jgi:hypothetical protein
MGNQVKLNSENIKRKLLYKEQSILIKNGFVYLAMEVRTGKTLTSLRYVPSFNEDKKCSVCYKEESY